MSTVEVVCPRCGAPMTAPPRYCSECGLELASQYQLPTREEWLARQGTAPRPEIVGALDLESPTSPSLDTADGARPEAGPTPTRSLRNALLGWAAVALAGGAGLSAIGDVLQLIDSIQSQAVAGLSVAYGLVLLSDLVATGAFAFAAVAFLGRSVDRSARLGIAAGLLGGAFVAALAGDTTNAAVFATHGVTSKLVVGSAFSAAADLGYAAAAVFAVSAFGRAADSTVSPLARRDGRLGAASLCLAVGLVLGMVSSILILLAFSDAGAPGGYTGGAGVDASGMGIASAAGITAAVAFLVSRSRQTAGRKDWFSRRDGMLGIAFGVLAVGFLLVTIGKFMQAGAVGGTGDNGKVVASYWLDAAGWLPIFAAPLCASVGFFLSQRSARAR